ncbi:MAG: 30S ribosomal protein S2, partial [Candidatus Marsarchaeota archaeon]|nr:30S ribosomal protein S2 [Candidatus Marsarchaeota archaeon]
MEEEKQEELLTEQNNYLETGIHIATKTRSPGMKRFVYKVREDGLYLLDLNTIDNRIRIAAAMVARYDPKEVVVTASRIYAIVPAEKFAEIIGAKFIKGRVTPGIFTNPNRDDFTEPKLILISDS